MGIRKSSKYGLISVKNMNFGNLVNNRVLEKFSSYITGNSYCCRPKDLLSFANGYVYN